MPNTMLPSLQARTKELRLELLNSERLQSHFEAHPDDLALLQHDKPLHRTAPAPHLKHIPLYLKDPSVHATKQTRTKGQHNAQKPRDPGSETDNILSSMIVPESDGGLCASSLQCQ